MRHRRIIHAVVSAILVVCGGVWARPTTRHEAEMAVTGWLGTDPQPLGMALGRRVATVETYTHDHGGPAYYVVYLQPSGFVVVSADDGVEPIIGFADDGAYDPSFDNPMGALVCGDLGGRMAAAIFDSRFSIFRRKHRKASPVGVSPREIYDL